QGCISDQSLNCDSFLSKPLNVAGSLLNPRAVEFVASTPFNHSKDFLCVPNTLRQQDKHKPLTDLDVTQSFGLSPAGVETQSGVSNTPPAHCLIDSPYSLL